MMVLARVHMHNGLTHGQVILQELAKVLVAICRECHRTLDFSQVYRVELIDDLNWNPGLDDIEVWIREPNPRVPLATYNAVFAYTRHYPYMQLEMDSFDAYGKPLDRNQEPLW